MKVEENVMSPWSIPASLTSSIPSATKPNLLPSRDSSSTSPLALCPKVKFRPTTTAAACSRSTRISWANSSAGVRASSAVNGITQNTSTPSSATSSARRFSVVSRAGWLPGRTTSAGCGSKVISTVGRSRSLATSTARRIRMLVAAVHAVEHPDRHHAASPAGRYGRPTLASSARPRAYAVIAVGFRSRALEDHHRAGRSSRSVTSATTCPLGSNTP